jgi:hypothetical protein
MRALQPKLLKDEHVIYTTGFHWVYVFKAFLPLALTLIGGSVVWRVAPTPLTSILIMLAIIGSIVWVALKVMDTMIKKAYVTNKRLIYRKGWAHRDTIDVTLDRIGGIKLDQDVYQRFFGYGTIQVIVPVIEIILPRFLRNPISFRNALSLQAPHAKSPEKPDDDEMAAEEHYRLARENDDRFGAETVSLKELREAAEELEGEELGVDLGYEGGAELGYDGGAEDDDAAALVDAGADGGDEN